MLYDVIKIYYLYYQNSNINILFYKFKISSPIKFEKILIILNLKFLLFKL